MQQVPRLPQAVRYSLTLLLSVPRQVPELANASSERLSSLATFTCETRIGQLLKLVHAPLSSHPSRLSARSTHVTAKRIGSLRNEIKRLSMNGNQGFVQTYKGITAGLGKQAGTPFVFFFLLSLGCEAARPVFAVSFSLTHANDNFDNIREPCDSIKRAGQHPPQSLHQHCGVRCNPCDGAAEEGT